MAENDLLLISNKMNRELDESDLIAAVRKDPRQFGDLYQRYLTPVFRYIYSRTGSQPVAEDITAQTFLAAFESFDRFRGNGRFAAWLFGIARNKVIDAYRNQSRSVPLEEVAEPHVDSDLLGGAIRSEQSNALAGIIAALNDDEQELLRLRYLADLSYREIAQLTGRREDAVKKTTYRLLARLHSQLEQSDER